MLLLSVRLLEILAVNRTLFASGETPYQCGECGRSFTFQQSYHKHLLYHTDEKPYCCSQCGRAFKVS
jgi:uncharacterized Zn-finger protein